MNTDGIQRPKIITAVKHAKQNVNRKEDGKNWIPKAASRFACRDSHRFLVSALFALKSWRSLFFRQRIDPIVPPGEDDRIEEKWLNARPHPGPRLQERGNVRRGPPKTDGWIIEAVIQ
jgi:hypothetical protein